MSSRILALMCGVLAMTVLDLSIVNVALPSIQADLHVRPADLQWVVVAYGVLLAGLLLLGGRAGDLAGHRRVLVTGVGVLAAASLAAGLSRTLGVLVAARAVQGAGAALAAPNALAILSRTFAEGPERNRALGIFGAAGGTAALAGSIAGGLLVEGPGWRWAFFLNVPLGAVLVVLVLAGAPADGGEDRRQGAYAAGAVALTAGLMAVALGLHQSVGSGWLSAPTLIPLLGGLFVQQVAHYAPLAAGASTIPIAVVSLAVSARVAPRAIDRAGAPRTLAGGLAALAAGLGLLVRVPADAGFLADLLPAYCVVGIGIGLAQVAVQIAAFAGVSRDEAGLAGGAVETAGEMGGALGVAVLVSVALAGAADRTAAFHRSVLVAAAFALAGAAVALVSSRPRSPGPSRRRPRRAVRR